MKFKIISHLCFWGLFGTLLYSKPMIHTSVFGEVQGFWQKPSQTDSLQPNISVLPVYILEYQESKPCDSCHWLSQNGLEFVMDNYLLKLATSLSAHSSVKLIHPEEQFVQANHLDLEPLLNRSKWPWFKVFYHFKEDFLFRKKDSFTPKQTKIALDQIGGKLGARYLLFSKDFKMKVYPLSSNGHTGKLQFQFYLVFWNVELSYPEWIVFFKTKTNITALSTF